MKHFPLHKPLIIGASVSAAPADRNPVKIFLKSRDRLGGVRSHAFPGATGARVLGQLKKDMLEGVSSVIAVDLMFWDSVIGLGDPRESQAYLRGLFNELIRRQIPVLIGDIPGIHDLQIHRDVTNEAIARECARHPHARVLHLDDVLGEVRRGGGITHAGRTYSIAELLPDGLHPSPAASRMLAERIEDALVQTGPDLASSAI